MDRHKTALKINISFYSIMPSCSRGCQHPTRTPLSLTAVHAGLISVSTSLPEVYHWPPEPLCLHP